MTHDRRLEWLGGLKVDDDVVIDGYLFDGGVFTRVHRLTLTQIIVGRGRKFRKSDGKEVGETHGFTCTRCRIEVPTNRTSEKRMRYRLKNRIRRISWDGISLDILIRIDAMLPEVE